MEAAIAGAPQLRDASPETLLACVASPVVSRRSVSLLPFPDRHGSRRPLANGAGTALLAAAKAGADAAGGLVLTAEQLSQHRAICGWCVAASAAGVGAFALTLPEAASAWHARRH